MDTDETETWISGEYPNNLNIFKKKNSDDECSEYSARFSESPNPVKSRAALFLSEVEQQLEAHKTRHDKTKSKLQYIKCLYDATSSEITDFKDIEPISNKNHFCRETNENIETIDEIISEDRSASEDAQFYDCLAETKKLQSNAQTEYENERSAKHNVDSFKTPLEPNMTFDIIDNENNDDLRLRTYFLDPVASHWIQSSNSIVAEHSETPFDFQNTIYGNQETDDISTTLQHSSEIQSPDYSKGFQKNMEKESQEAIRQFLPIENEDIYSREILKSSRNSEPKKELIVNISGSVESIRTVAKNTITRSEKYRKIKRKKRRIKTSNSRSTTATRDQSFPETNKKDLRKRNQRICSTLPASHLSRNRRENATKIQKYSKEISEIYHNDAVKMSESISVVSSKHSKLEMDHKIVVRANKKYNDVSGLKTTKKIIENRQNSEENRNDALEKLTTQQQKSIQRSSERKTQETCKNHQKILQNDNQRSDDSNKTKLNYEVESPKNHGNSQIIQEIKSDDNYKLPRRKNSRFPDHSSIHDDIISLKNYELPTVASKLKQVDRSYFSRYNFRNLPFVVGTSVTPSFNLALNIQETMSLIKTRQMIPNGVMPLLINEMSKGMQPVSTLLTRFCNQQRNNVEETNIRLGFGSRGSCNVYPSQMIQRISCGNHSESFFETEENLGNNKLEVPTSKQQKTRSICSSAKLNSRNSRKNVKNHNESQSPNELFKRRQEELKIIESKSIKFHNYKHSLNGIEQVLRNYHDQFEAMTLKSEKLRKQAEKNNDEALQKEIAALEKELNAKEEEINAVVSLYMEVMDLKKQMKMLNERNSLVCVSSVSPGNPLTSYPYKLSSRAQTANRIRTINLYRTNTSENHRNASSSSHLADLLRQMKSYQKQLKSCS